jgi:hypothetical protein
MVCDYTSIQREIVRFIQKKTKLPALDHFEFSEGDRNYHFFKLSRGSLPIDRVLELAYQILYALEFIHRAQVIHVGPTLPVLYSVT